MVSNESDLAFETWDAENSSHAMVLNSMQPNIEKPFFVSLLQRRCIRLSKNTQKGGMLTEPVKKLMLIGVNMIDV